MSLETKKEMLLTAKNNMLHRLAIVEIVKQGDVALMEWIYKICNKVNLQVIKSKNSMAYQFEKNRSTDQIISATCNLDPNCKEPLTDLITILATHLLFAGGFWGSEPVIGDTAHKREFRKEVFVMISLLIFVFFDKNPWAWIFDSVFQEETEAEIDKLLIGETSQYSDFLFYLETIVDDIQKDTIDLDIYKTIVRQDIAKELTLQNPLL